MTLKDHLEEVYRSVDTEARRAADPVYFPRRYSDSRDIEVAGILAAVMAYGRVTLFGAVLRDLFEILDAGGGPRAYVDRFEPAEASELLPIKYRFNTGVDFLLLFSALRRVYAEIDSLEDLMHPVSDTVEPGLIRIVDRLRSEAVAASATCGVEAATFRALPRGFQYFLPSPETGSACKRWNMFLRWMVRPAREGIDLGIWKSVPPRALVVPLDTHVLRIARFIGLTSRKDGSWRTAMDVTRALRELDPQDPIRFDFSLAHLGISGACKGYRHDEICSTCPLDPICTATHRA